MVVSTNCSLNFLPPCPSSTSVSRITQVPCRPSKTRSLKSRCLIGLTCLIIGSDLGDFVILGDQEKAMARDLKNMSGSQLVDVNVSRWSDRRTCKPWRLNSLETIVPENLPRPSGKRGWEGIGSFGDAPPVKVIQKTGAKSCFLL